MLPFAIPAYVLAFVFVGLLDFAGPVQSALREVVRADAPASGAFHWRGDHRAGAGVLPYVYLLARTAFWPRARA
jgi:iron(III) transport system permease protein